MASPVDANRAGTNGSTAANPAVVSLPSGIVAGDTLVIKFRCNNATITTPSGWTSLVNIGPSEAGTDDGTLIAWRKADGTEGSTVSVTLNVSAKFAAIVWRITGATDPTVRAPEISTQVSGTTATPDPGSVTPTGGSKDYLFLWLGGWTGEQTSPPASNPTNYSNPTGADSGIVGATAGNCRVAGASRQLTASSEDPGSWTIDVAAPGWSAWTLAIHPAPSASVDSSRPLMMNLGPRTAGSPALLMRPPPSGFFVNAQTFNQALTATATSTATITNSVGKILSATATATATLVKSVGKVVSATATSTASIVKSVGKDLSATVTSTATMVRSVGKVLTATATSTASIVLELLVAAYPPLAPLLITLRRGLAGGPPLLRPMEPGPTVITTTTFQQALTATATTTAAIVKSVGKSLTATATSTASIVKNVGKALTATATSTASIVKSVGKTLTATVTSTASIVANKIIVVALTATSTATAVIAKSVGKALSATATTTASIIKSVGKTLSATATTTASMVRSVGLTLTATVTTTASLVAQFVQGFVSAISQPLLMKLKLSRQGPPITPAGESPAPPAGTIFNQALTATVTTAVSIVRSIGKAVAATATTTASIVKSAGKTLSATSTSTANIARSVGKALSAPATASATMVKSVGKRLTATVTSIASMVADAIIAGAIKVLGYFGIAARGSTESRAREGGFSSGPSSGVGSDPDSGEFDSSKPGGEMD